MSVTFQTLVTNRVYNELVLAVRVAALAKGQDPNSPELAEDAEFQDGSINASNVNARNIMQALALHVSQYNREAFACWPAAEVLHRVSKWLSGPRIEDQGYEVAASIGGKGAKFIDCGVRVGYTTEKAQALYDMALTAIEKDGATAEIWVN